MKKWVISIIALSFLFCGCQNSHYHTFDMNSYDYDSTYHWHPSTCGHDVTSAKAFHIFEEEIIPATYENGGYTIHKCTKCGYSYSDNETEKLTHNYSASWSFDETTHWYKCTDEGYEDLRFEESPHKFIVSTVAPTYEEGGYTKHTCQTCGYFYIDHETNPLVHKYSENWTYNETTHWHACLDAGYESLKKDEGSHTFENTVVDPTYENDGYTLHTCKTCGYFYKDSYVEKLIHNHSDDWTFDETTHWHKCTDEGYLDEKIGVENHNFSVETVEPTKKDEGYTLHTCSVCGYSFKTDIVDAIGFTITWKNWDNSIIYTQENVQYGTMPEYEDEIPEKKSTAQYHYDFIGWSPELAPVEDDTTYVAVFSSAINQYKVTFDAGNGYFDNDKTKHTKTIMVNYGEVPVFDEEPKGVSIQYSNATFTGWNKSFSTVYSEQYYSATYSYSGAQNTVFMSYEYNSNARTVSFYTSADSANSGSWYVDWGDGTTNDLKNKSHTYSVACSGIYFIRMYYLNTTYNTYFSLTSNSYPIASGNSYIRDVAMYLNAGSTRSYLSNRAFYGLGLTSFTYRSPDPLCISTGCFENCNKLKSVDIQATQEIGQSAFANCSSLSSLNLGDTTQLATVSSGAFSRCSSLTTFSVSSNKLSLTLGSSAFSYCSSLSSISFGSSKLTSIGSSCFYNCGFTSFRLYSSVTSIGGSAFAKCSKMTSLYYGGTKSQFLNISIGNGVFTDTQVTEVICSDGELPIG